MQVCFSPAANMHANFGWTALCHYANDCETKLPRAGDFPPTLKLADRRNFAEKQPRTLSVTWVFAEKARRICSNPESPWGGLLRQIKLFVDPI